MKFMVTVEDTKASEIAFMEKLRSQFSGTGLYLEGLFSQDLVGWVINKIRSDFPCDLYECYDHYMRKDFYHAQVVRDREETIGNLESQLKAAHEHEAMVVQGYEESAEAARTVYANMCDNLKKCREDLHNAFDAKHAAIQENIRLKEEVLKLKAELYDHLVVAGKVFPMATSE